MTYARPCQIEALFGSAHRRDNDTFSDIDYLIADDDMSALTERKLFLKTSGFSVSDYSLRRLRRLFERRTLFAAHLKFESRATFDVHGEFAALKEGLDPLRDYSVERGEAERLFAPLEIIPDCSIGAMWALDHLAVAFRNFSIVNFAQRGQFIFAQDHLLEAHCQDGTLDPDSLSTFQKLRVAKHRYRSGNVIHDALPLAQRAIDASRRILGVDLDSKFAEGPCLTDVAPSDNSTDAYIRLRELEREIVSVPVSCLSPDVLNVREDILRTVRDPHGYLWRAMYEPHALGEAMEELRSGYLC